MSDLTPEFYRKAYRGHLHQVIALHELKEPHWDLLSEQAPLLPRSWFELSRLPLEDRIDFTRGYWLSKLPLLPPQGTDFTKRIQLFFDAIEEIGIFLSQERPGLPFDVHMIYALEGQDAFFHGSPPASKEALENLQRQFSHIRFPKDYLAFLEIHDGFSKYTDTGLIRVRELPRTYLRFQEVLSGEILLNDKEEIVAPKSLIPFYEFSILHAYQCFYADWYAHEEMGMGNVSYVPHEPDSDGIVENHLEMHMAFPTFLSWFLFYLEDI